LQYKRAFLVKADIKEVYRMIPVHPEDQRFLGVRWNGAIYMDKILPFGFCSAPKSFSAVTDALLWILNKKGIVRPHYLDDFILVAQDRHAAQRQKHILL